MSPRVSKAIIPSSLPTITVAILTIEETIVAVHSYNSAGNTFHSSENNSFDLIVESDFRQ
jgi:hypothetical protein